MTRERGLTKQVQDVLDSKLKIGHSKYIDKKLRISSNYIYSWNTYRTYLKHCCYFVKWAKNEYGCKNLDNAREYIKEYLEMRINGNLSAYTQKLEAAALAKLYSCSSKDFDVITDVRCRSNITRSRGQKLRDKHFSEEKNSDFVNFCKSTGLRRSELKLLRKEHLHLDENGNYYLDVVGKGGRRRKAIILDNKAVDFIENSINDKIFPKVPNGADIHSYRADYCTAVYNKFARFKDNIPKSDRYYCRGDLKGICYDKKAMKIASQALGHNRISVIASHYIRKD